jgi:hypothetical protein
MSYVYKILMNSLYGRFGINPLCRVTDIVSKDERENLLKRDGFMFSEQISQNCYVVKYLKNTYDVRKHHPAISAVQLAAAKPGSARIYMHPFILRDDCIYTDTDSAVTQTPLPPESLSSTVLGKLKLEDKIRMGIFLALLLQYVSS